MPRIVVEVSGGVVQAITADHPIEVLLLDYDNIKVGDKPQVGYPVEVDVERVARLWSDPLCEVRKQAHETDET